MDLVEATKIVRVIRAAKALKHKLQEVGEDSGFKGIFVLAAVHECEYTGPQWDDELEELSYALDCLPGSEDL